MRPRFSSMILAIAMAIGACSAHGQNPRPQPVPLPDREPEHSSPPAGNDQKSNDTAGSAAEEPSLRSFTGKILKDGEKYVLQEISTKTTYKLDKPEKAQPYAGKTVTISGTLDDGKIIHIATIALAK